MQKDVADALAGRGPTRFPCEDDLAAALGQRLRKAARLKRLPGSLAPFKGKEEAALHR